MVCPAVRDPGSLSYCHQPAEHCLYLQDQDSLPKPHTSNRLTEGGKDCLLVFIHIWASLVAQLVKNLPAMLETWVQSLGWEDPLEESMATHSNTLAWRIPMNRGAWRATVHRVAKSWT